MAKSIGHFAFQQLLVFIAIAFFLGCGPDESNPVLDEQSYYPLRVGDFRVYKIGETRISPIDVKEIFNYQIKTVVSDSFMNSAGIYSYIITRYKRATTLANWESLDTWTARVDSKEVVVNEGNVPFVKITFPVQSGREWNGNAYNNEASIEFCEGSDFIFSCDLYSFGDLKKAFITSEGIIFDNTIEVVENNSLDPIVMQDIRKEIYAWDVGLVYREITLLKYCTVGSCIGKQKVEDGLIYHQELIDYGHQ